MNVSLKPVLPVFLLALTAMEAQGQRRVMQPEDLFRVDRVSRITWSPDGNRAAVELRRPGKLLDQSIPTASLAMVDVASATLRVISPASPAVIGWFGAAWSPTGRRLLFFSLDTNAVIRPWLWTAGAAAPAPLRGLQLHTGLADPPVALWSDGDHAVLMVRDSLAPNDGPLSAGILRGQDIADAWRKARAAKTATATVIDSRAPEREPRSARIVSLDVRTGAITVLAQGPLHRPRLSRDGRTLSYRRENPPFSLTPVERFFVPEAAGEAAYDLVNWGNEIHYVDSRTGAPAPRDTTSRTPPAPLATLRVVNDPATGTRLRLERPGMPDTVLWRGNTWVRGLELGRAEPIRYAAQDGTPLTGWLLYPPGPPPSRPLPIVMVVYPGSVFGATPPGSFDVFNERFQHPQMLAALGYGVVLPSMPEPGMPMQARGLDSLAGGVLPLLDTLIARGIADSTRIALLGQSAGGYATLGLITQTGRFRTAIASASYANLTSLYGTFYGQYRYADAPSPQRSQLLRMLQFERGYYGAAAPPWEQPERYRANSPIERVAGVQTPLLLIHGDQDFIPLQQAEEFFTALYRQDKRVRLVRYAGEGHTISARANVLDMWRRIEQWLRETMP